MPGIGSAGVELEAGCSLLELKCATLADSVEALTGKLREADARPDLIADPRSCALETAGGAVGGVITVIAFEQLRQVLRKR